MSYTVVVSVADYLTCHSFKAIFLFRTFRPVNSQTGGNYRVCVFSDFKKTHSYNIDVYEN